ncbi:hypothetical protein Ddye_006489 [Dipteronia dyeriana]|uniref:Zinc finger GRF-type domain-containing protein n=1 Tax=Dipteronia dyeriana TaxID=168575 RepID=A0AAD9XI37_9ROSI|nr:hypothetical protein Ddye_006489 [Dipteronia dyeriana]
MEATSSSTINMNGGLIKFKNRRCSCGVKAGVKISESQNNPRKLYFACERGKCKFYSFWVPDNEEFNQAEYIENIREINDGRDNFMLQQEMTAVNARLQSLELLWEMVQHLETLHTRMYNLEINITNIHGRMHQLEYNQGGSKLLLVVNLVCVWCNDGNVCT